MIKKFLSTFAFIVLALLVGAFFVYGSVKDCFSFPEVTSTRCVDTFKKAEWFVADQTYTKAVNVLDSFGGFRGKAFLLLQNDNELRANGGFIGSYAVVDFGSSPLSVRFEDIYTPDGQITGHIDPPAPIQEAFKLGTFRLRDADWEPDFPTFAKSISWFMDKGNEQNPDAVVSLSFSEVKRLIGVIGEVNVPEYNFDLNEDNLYSFLQGKSEIGFFAGSTQKKDAISSVGKAVLRKIQGLSWKEKLSLVRILFEELDRGNMVVYFSDQKLESKTKDMGWDGGLVPVGYDSVSVIETNLGANKANCCVNRQTEHVIKREEGAIKHKITITFDNQSISENPTPPTFYGGNYISYLRFYVPIGAKDIKVSSNEFNTDEKYGFKEIGFFNTTKAKQQSQVSLEYSLADITGYTMTILKQNGLRQSPQIVDLFGKRLVTSLEEDFSVSE